MPNSEVETNDSKDIAPEEEGIETPQESTSTGGDSSSGDDDDTSEVEDSDLAFKVLPALRRSESFIRRRVEKRQCQENLVQRKKNGASKPAKTQSGPVDLDEIDDEEKAIRRHSNYGSFGILPSSLSDGGIYRSYRRERLIKEIDSANQRGRKGHEDILETLRNARTLVFIIDAKVAVTNDEVVDGIRKVVDHVRLDPEHQDHPNNQKCLLYRDFEGRLFNLVLPSEYSSMEGAWRGNLKSFSVVQAAALFSFLTRSLSCAFDLETTDSFRQVSLIVILGLVFIEEISLSWTNVGLLVRGYPSLSAFALSSNLVGSDWLRKLLILVFVVASASTDATFQKVCTLGGILLTCLVLLANLGSHSWKYLHWKPFRGLRWFGALGFPLDSLLGYLAAILAGLCFPFMGHSIVEAGGTAAIESVMRIAVIVAALFILSDFDAFQRLLVKGSDACNQDYVYFFVGGWWTLSLVASLTVLFCREVRKSKEFDPFKRDNQFPNDEEPLLEEEHRSPIGYKVPHLPLFPINPDYTHKGLGSCCSSYQLGLEYVLSLLVALGLGGFICYLGVTKLDDQFLSDPL